MGLITSFDWTFDAHISSFMALWKSKKTKGSGLQMKSNRKHFEKLVFLVVGGGALLAREEERGGGGQHNPLNSQQEY